jgi:hypothetical protein
LSAAGEQLISGWRERVDLPDWGVARLLAKADTGAYSSAVHAENIVHQDDDTVAFDVVYRRNHPERRVRVEAPIARSAIVRSSNGETHERIFVNTTLKIGPIVKTIEVTLVARELMQCRMLIGRSALCPELTVDPSNKYLLTRAPRPVNPEAAAPKNAHPD